MRKRMRQKEECQRRQIERFEVVCTSSNVCVFVSSEMQSFRETKINRGRKRREEKQEKEKTDEEGFVVVGNERETLTVRRALPFSRGVVADWRRCGLTARYRSRKGNAKAKDVDFLNGGKKNWQFDRKIQSRTRNSICGKICGIHKNSTTHLH